MLITKLFFGFGLLVLGCFYFENQRPFDVVISKNSYGSTTKAIAVPQSQTVGKEIYTDFCMQCHGANGKGDLKNFPPLDGSDWLKNKRTQSIHAVKFGQSGPIVVNKMKFNNSMPPMGLTDKEVTDVMNYIMNSWSNKQRKLVTEKEVLAIKN